MNSDLDNSKLQLKSVYGRRCLTECYPKGATYLHPVLLTGIKNDLEANCAVDPVHSSDPSYQKEYDMILADKCRLDDNALYKIPNELESILLTFYFNPRDFLSSIYDINSFDDAIYWTLENDHQPFDTILRVNNSAWKVYGISELSANVFEYYYSIGVEHWLKDYLKIIQDKYSFEIISDGNDDDMYDLLKEKYFSYDFFVKAIRRYVYKNLSAWDKIDKHYFKLKAFIFEQLIGEMEK